MYEREREERGGGDFEIHRMLKSESMYQPIVSACEKMFYYERGGERENGNDC